jgi:hypothetical protein
MRVLLTFVMIAAFLGASSVLATAHAQGAAGTGLGPQFGITTRPTPLVPRARIPAATGGIISGNVTGGIDGSTRSGTGGLQDMSTFGARTGGIVGSGSGQSAFTGGIRDQATYGRNTGGISGTQLGAGTGGIGNLNSLGTETGGINEAGLPPPAAPSQ